MDDSLVAGKPGALTNLDTFSWIQTELSEWKNLKNLENRTGVRRSGVENRELLVCERSWHRNVISPLKPGKEEKDTLKGYRRLLGSQVGHAGETSSSPRNTDFVVSCSKHGAAKHWFRPSLVPASALSHLTSDKSLN